MSLNMKTSLFVVESVLCIALASPATCLAQAEEAKEVKRHSANTPVVRNWTSWKQHHNAVAGKARWQKDSDIVFIGDSITAAWRNVGIKAWDKYYGNRNMLNISFSGDRTQHALWRVYSTEIETMKPKVAS